MVRPDIDRVEVQGECEHHHGVLRPRRESDYHVSDPKRKHRYHDQRECGGNCNGDGEGAKGSRKIAHEQSRTRIRKSGARDGAQREYGGAPGPPWQRHMDQVDAMEESGTGHGAEHQAARKSDAQHG
jgi:hypothetical protein